MPDYITTYTRKHFDPLHPDAQALCVEDIAHALSLLCRGNGHVSTFFSVGRHCILCCREAMARGYSDRLALACLLHDASEAYLSDVPRPFKRNLQAYVEAEDRFLAIIYTHFLGSPLTEEEGTLLKGIDDDLLAYDLTYLLDEPQELPTLHVPVSYQFEPFERTEQEYLSLYQMLRSRL